MNFYVRSNYMFPTQNVKQTSPKKNASVDQ